MTIQTIYWIVALAVMVLFLIGAVFNLVANIKSNKIQKEIDKKYIEYLDKQIKLLENKESEDK